MNAYGQEQPPLTEQLHNHIYHHHPPRYLALVKTQMAIGSESDRRPPRQRVNKCSVQ